MKLYLFSFLVSLLYYLCRMKNIWTIFITFSLCFIACTTQLSAQSETLFTGFIENAKSPGVALTYLVDDLSGDEMYITSTMSDGSSFFISMELDKLVEVSFYNGPQFISKVWLEPGEELQLYVNLADIAGTLTFKGEKSAKNLYYIAFNDRFPEFNKRAFFYDPFSFYTSEDIKKSMEMNRGAENHMMEVEQNYTAQTQFLEEFNSVNPLTSEQYDIASSRLNYRRLNDKIFYYIFRQRMEDPLGSVMDMALQDEMLNVEYNDLILLTEREFTNFLGTYVAYLRGVNIMNGATEDSPSETYKIIDLGMTGEAKYYMLTRLIVSDLKQKSTRVWTDNMTEFNTYVTNERYLNVIDRLYSEVNMYAPGSPVPFVQLPNLNGEKISLQDYNGQLVFVSFWASWCGPCIVNFRKYAQDKAELEEIGVKFVNIALDKNEMLSITAISKNEIKGENLLAAGSLGDIMTEFQIDALPVYFVMDQNGNFTDLQGDLGKVKKDLRAMLGY